MTTSEPVIASTKRTHCVQNNIPWTATEQTWCGSGCLLNPTLVNPDAEQYALDSAREQGGPLLQFCAPSIASP